jgi:translation initiation factor 4A
MASEQSIENVGGGGGDVEIPEVESFDDMGIPESLLRGVYAYGFEKPSAVQRKAIVPALTGRDIIVQAQSGTGKTGTFAISVLGRIDTTVDPYTQALVLAPTRELAQQGFGVIKSLGEYMGVRVHALLKGNHLQEDIRVLRSGVHVAVGTPGRVYDMITRGALRMDTLRMFIVDEADQMLSLGFKEQLVEIFGTGLPQTAQVALYSATMPPDALELTKRFMQNPIKILVPVEKLSLEGIQQFQVNVKDEGEKPSCLADIYGVLSVSQCIIFCNTCQRVEQLAGFMRENNFAVDVIHSDLTPDERSRAVESFKAGSSRVLIASGILSRGVDVQGLSLVINFDLPRGERGVEEYLHRVGRVGRFGRKGVAVNIVSQREAREMKYIEDHYKIKVDPMPEPGTLLSAM